LLGDPGLGKSQLLQAAAAVSPRGIYVCGNGTTKAGLTVAVVRDPMTSDYAFEAGSYFLLYFHRNLMSWLSYDSICYVCCIELYEFLTNDLSLVD
jgi:hypothetical protein